MMMMKRSALALIAAVALATPTVASQLQLGWYVDGDEQEQKLRALLDEYTKSHPDTTFDLQITPYDGMSVTGWPVGTIVRGRRVMWDNEIVTPATGEPCRFAECLPVG